MESKPFSPWNLKKATVEELRNALKTLPGMLEILQKNVGLDEKRNELFELLTNLERNAYAMDDKIDRALALQAIRVFKNIISKENERMAGFSTLQVLCDALAGKTDVSEGFVDEMENLLIAMQGKANYSKGWLPIPFVDFLSKKGREAAKLRSDFLDSVWNYIKKSISRFPSGLDPKIIEKRESQRRILLDYFGIDDGEWY